MERRAAPTRTSRAHLGKKVLRYTDQLFGAVDSKAKRPNLDPKRNYQRTGERRTLCDGKGQAQDLVHLGKLSRSQGMVLMRSLLFEAALVSPPGLGQGHNATVEGNRRGRGALKFEETSKGEKNKTDVRSKRRSH